MSCVVDVLTVTYSVMLLCILRLVEMWIGFCVCCLRVLYVQEAGCVSEQFAVVARLDEIIDGS